MRLGISMCLRYWIFFRQSSLSYIPYITSSFTAIDVWQRSPRWIDQLCLPLICWWLYYGELVSLLRWPNLDAQTVVNFVAFTTLVSFGVSWLLLRISLLSSGMFGVLVAAPREESNHTKVSQCSILILQLYQLLSYQVPFIFSRPSNIYQ